jgi:hypothetical protein
MRDDTLLEAVQVEFGRVSALQRRREGILSRKADMTIRSILAATVMVNQLAS